MGCLRKCHGWGRVLGAFICASGCEVGIEGDVLGGSEERMAIRANKDKTRSDDGRLEGMHKRAVDEERGKESMKEFVVSWSI